MSPAGSSGRARRVTPRRLVAAMALLGVLAGLAFLIVPVDAAFAGDPLLRLEVFAPGSSAAVTGVRCGSPLANLDRHGQGLSLYSLALDRACRDASSRRAATAAAAVAVVGILGTIGLAGPRIRGVAA